MKSEQVGLESGERWRVTLLSTLHWLGVGWGVWCDRCLEVDECSSTDSLEG